MQERKRTQKQAKSTSFTDTKPNKWRKNDSSKDLATLVALQSIKGLGSRNVGWLLSQLESPHHIWTAPPEYWAKVGDQSKPLIGRQPYVRRNMKLFATLITELGAANFGSNPRYGFRVDTLSCFTPNTLGRCRSTHSTLG